MHTMNCKNFSSTGTKMCFLALDSYPLLANIDPDNIVGPDVHQVILAKELTKYGYKVSVIAYGQDGTTVEYIDKIKIIKIKRSNSRLKIFKILLSTFRIWQGMIKSNACIYYHAGGMPGVSPILCKLARRKYIYEIGSDALVNRELINQKTNEFSGSRFSIGFLANWLDIKLADSIIVQNKYQKIMLKRNFSRDGFLIKMPFEIKGSNEKPCTPVVLWVGSMAKVKQPELFEKLAEAIPEARFQMIGGHYGNQELYDRIKDGARKYSNLHFLGVVPFNEIEKYFSHASILVNTSMFEGFPNAFIQAWMNYVPVVSLNSDPDDVIYENKLGFHSKTFEQMVKDVKILLKDKELRKEMGRNARHYVEREHNIDNLINKYINVLDR